MRGGLASVQYDKESCFGVDSFLSLLVLYDFGAGWIGISDCLILGEEELSFI